MKEEDKQRKRLSLLMRKLNMNQTQFAESIGVNTATVGNVLSGKNNLSKRMIDKICQAHDVSRDWLVFGVDSQETMPSDAAGVGCDLGSRIIELLGDLNKSQSDFAKEYKVSRQMMNAILKGKNALPEKMALRICLNYGVSYDWLVQGKGPKYMGGSPRKDTATLVHLVNEIQDDFAALQKKFDDLKSIIEE